MTSHRQWRWMILGAGTVTALYWIPRPWMYDVEPTYIDLNKPIPPRNHHLTRLARATPNDPLDVLIVGGGATGTACALDAATRGLKIALVDRNDFASGTSSRSTKLIHGGVRYLEKAFFNLDYEQLKLVFEALHERSVMMNNVPYLSNAIPIMVPCYKSWQLPYYWGGMKAYDLVAGTKGLTLSRFVSPQESLRVFPMLAPRDRSGNSLKGTIVYYDGQFNDARLCVIQACSAAAAGAIVGNYLNVEWFLRNDEGNIIGARVQDKHTGERYNVYAKVVVNATGCFSDSLRDTSKMKMIQPSSGVHVTLPAYYSPDSMGLIVPKTEDGRVVFMLPWLKHTIAGTTDTPCRPEQYPKPSEEDIQFILKAIDPYLTVSARRQDVQSAWSGIRPLAADPNAENTEAVSRDHVVVEEEDGLITIAGGKWTTCRKMAEDVVNIVSDRLGNRQKCTTSNLPLRGSLGWSRATYTAVAQNYIVPHRPGSIDTSVAEHLSTSYGSDAFEITRLAEKMNLGRRLVQGHPIIEAEIIYCVRNEYCETAKDFVSTRTRLAFLDIRAAKQSIPRVVELMSQELDWSDSRKLAEFSNAMNFLDTFNADN